MKTIELSTASRPLSAYAHEFGEEGEPVILTANQQPIAVILSLKQFDPETLALSLSQEFIALIEQTRQELNVVRNGHLKRSSKLCSRRAATGC
jgi:PHD/YefM family antitoxin component YafN of YafNO toxin-antitoxin module